MIHARLFIIRIVLIGCLISNPFQLFFIAFYRQESSMTVNRDYQKNRYVSNRSKLANCSNSFKSKLWTVAYSVEPPREKFIQNAMSSTLHEYSN